MPKRCIMYAQTIIVGPSDAGHQPLAEKLLGHGQKDRVTPAFGCTRELLTCFSQSPWAPPSVLYHPPCDAC
jgi:hypothetical protein